MSTIQAVVMSPRSRSSLTMSVIHALGGAIAGEQFPDFDKMSPERRAAAIDLNPNGYWELPGVVMGGLRRADHLDGQVVKLSMQAMVRTPVDLVSRAIVCLRPPIDVAVSQSKLLHSGEVADRSGEWRFQQLKVSPVRYVLEAGRFARFLAELDDERLARFVPFDTDALIELPRTAAAFLAARLGLEPDAKRLDAAASRVDPAQTRTTAAAWDPELEAVGGVADRLYAALLAMDRGQLLAASAEAEAASRDLALENARWVDERVWLEVNPGLCRSIDANHNGVRDALLQTLAQNRVGRLIPDVCSHYSRDHQKTVTVERPSDLGPITIPQVFCKRDQVHKTLAQCIACWQRGSVADGVRLGPQRLRERQPMTRKEAQR